MKFKILLLAILLILLLTPMSFAQMPQELQKTQNNDYGIESEEFYPGELLLEILLAAEEEIELVAQEAYAEGYKAAMLQYAPDLAALRVTEATLRLELERERKNNKLKRALPYIIGGVSFLGGYGIHALISR